MPEHGPADGVRAFLGLGSNLGDRLENLRRAVEGLMGMPGIGVVRSSRVYETEPVGPPQPDFLNAVIEVETSLTPRELLQLCKQVERRLGRRTRGRWQQREVDCDILLVGDERVADPDLRVPHPEMTSRAFVLVPLSDLAPSLMVEGLPVLRWLDDVGRSGVRLAHPPEALWPPPRR